jgi:hypothetical protein
MNPTPQSTNVPASTSTPGAVPLTTSTTPLTTAPAPTSTAALEFLWKVHAYTNDHIKFGDGKAGALLAWSSALIAGLYSTKIHYHFTKVGGPTICDIEFGPTVFAAFSLGAFILLGLSATAGILAIWPRMWTGGEDEDDGWWEALLNRFQSLTQTPIPPDGLIFWLSVQKHESGTAYQKSVSGLQTSDYEIEVAKHIYQLGRICKAKYFWITRSVYLSFLGSVLGAVVALFGS